MIVDENLSAKLAVKSGQRIIVRRCPDEWHDAFRGLGAAFDRGTIAEVTVSFVRAQSEIDNACKEAVALTAPHGVLWMAYPKGGAALVWDSFVHAGWHPASEIALDDTWSAVRFSPRGDG
ncbi:MAG: hypothetical protein ACRENA_11725 [Vulcanimicrobiaceae bacterium]